MARTEGRRPYSRESRDTWQGARLSVSGPLHSGELDEGFYSTNDPDLQRFAWGLIRQVQAWQSRQCKTDDGFARLARELSNVR